MADQVRGRHRVVIRRWWASLPRRWTRGTRPTLPRRWTRGTRPTLPRRWTRGTRRWAAAAGALVLAGVVGIVTLLQSGGATACAAVLDAAPFAAPFAVPGTGSQSGTATYYTL